MNDSFLCPPEGIYITVTMDIGIAIDNIEIDRDDIDIDETEVEI